MVQRVIQAVLGSMPAITHQEILPPRPLWLGRQDSNLGMAESKSTYSAFDFKGYSEKIEEFGPFLINRLARLSECAVTAAQAIWCSLLHRHHIVGLLDCECQCEKCGRLWVIN